MGFGQGNYQDARMQKLAQAGNGVAGYIDNLTEARKVFVDGLFGTLFTIAKDVKIQVEFNPGRIAEYRLVGYETRLLDRSDFNNDRVDAGDIGSGHTVTAIYEVTLVGSPGRMVDPLRYPQGAAPVTPTANTGEYAFVKVRYKLPNEDTSHLITRPVTEADVVADFAKLPDDLRFAAAVAGAGQLLRRDPYIHDFTYDRAIEIAQNARGADPYGYRNEFVQMLRAAKSAAAMSPLEQPGQGGNPL
jgi:Ca-activated chloride channel family protein